RGPGGRQARRRTDRAGAAGARRRRSLQPPPPQVGRRPRRRGAGPGRLRAGGVHRRWSGVERRHAAGGAVTIRRWGRIAATGLIVATSGLTVTGPPAPARASGETGEPGDRDAASPGVDLRVEA